MWYYFVAISVYCIVKSDFFFRFNCFFGWQSFLKKKNKAIVLGGDEGYFGVFIYFGMF